MERFWPNDPEAINLGVWGIRVHAGNGRRCWKKIRARGGSGRLQEVLRTFSQQYSANMTLRHRDVNMPWQIEERTPDRFSLQKSVAKFGNLNILAVMRNWLHFKKPSAEIETCMQR
jgi:hypothetical protein